MIPNCETYLRQEDVTSLKEFRTKWGRNHYTVGELFPKWLLETMLGVVIWFRKCLILLYILVYCIEIHCSHTYMQNDTFFRYTVVRGCRSLRSLIQLATKWNFVFLYQYLVVDNALFTLLSLHLKLSRTKACSKGNNKNGIDTNKLTLQKAFNKSLINWRQQQ